MRYYIFGINSNSLNDLTISVKSTINTVALHFSPSVLHAKIRLFEGILNLSYKIPVRDKEAEKDNIGEISRRNVLDRRYVSRQIRQHQRW